MYFIVDLGKLSEIKGSYDQHQTILIVFKEAFQGFIWKLSKSIWRLNLIIEEITLKAHNKVWQIQKAVTFIKDIILYSLKLTNAA